MSLRSLTNGNLRTLVLGALLSGVATVGYGQEPSSLQPGSRVRLRSIEAGSKWLQGDLLRASDDLVTLVAGGGRDTLTVATGSVTQVEVSHGRYSGAGQGLAIGAAVGAGLGLILGVAAATEDCQGFICYEVGPEDVMAVTGILGLVGGGLGALIGSASQRERWAPASLPRATAKVGPRSRGVGVALSLQF